MADSPTTSETQKAIDLLTNEKAPKIDSIPVEIYKAGGTKLTEELAEFCEMWRHQHILQDFKNAFIIQLYKR